MLNDTELNAKEQSLHDALNSLLQNYKTLSDDYKSLKSDYEEEKEGREKYKRLARGAPPTVVSNGTNGTRSSGASRPFVLVLIDGDQYTFNERLLKLEEDGGARAAQDLHNAIESCLTSKRITGCDIVVRVYADFLGLSKRLSLSKLIKPHKRSIDGFASAFNGMRPLFDFVDVGQGTDGTFKKISGNVARHDT